MMRRVLVVLALILVAVVGVQAAEIQPHMAGWERIFALEYGPGQYRGKPAVEGTVTNISPYDLTNIRLLVDTLDAGGEIKNQQVAWVPGELRGGGRLFFSVPTAPAPAYRVRVYTYDRIEAAGGNQR
jgi:hypothetical protein